MYALLNCMYVNILSNTLSCTPTTFISYSIYIYNTLYIRVCICVYIYIYIHKYIHVCACVYVINVNEAHI